MNRFSFHLRLAKDALNAAAELIAATEDAGHPRSHFLMCAERWIRCARTNIAHAAAELPATSSRTTETRVH